MISVMIADDHAILRDGLVELLRRKGFDVVGEAGDGETAMEIIIEKRPDIAILDIAMPGLSGIGIAEVLSKKDINTKVIILTMYKEYSYAVKAFSVGAYGYVLKEDAFSDLEYAIRSAMEGKKFLSPSVSNEFAQTGVSGLSVLTKREEEVLRLIASGLTNKEIASKLGISVKTVETHRTRIMQKLDVHNAAELVRCAARMGLL